MGAGSSKSPSTPQIAEPEPAPVPEKIESPKPVTEAATQARDEQKEKAAKAAGLNGSILTSPLTTTTNAKTKSLLGQ